jgi:hypothetical protein
VPPLLGVAVDVVVGGAEVVVVGGLEVVEVGGADVVVVVGGLDVVVEVVGVDLQLKPTNTSERTRIVVKAKYTSFFECKISFTKLTSFKLDNLLTLIIFNFLFPDVTITSSCIIYHIAIISI